MANPVEITGGTVGQVNFAAAAAAGALLPLCAELDAFLGLQIGPLTASLQAQFSAALDFSLNAGLAITSPTLSVTLVLQALAQLQASLQASLALPSIALSLDAGVSASIALAAALEVRLGLLNASISALLALKMGAVELAAQMAGSLSAGPIVLLEFGETVPTTLAQNGVDIAAKFASGLSLGGGVSPTDVTLGYILVTKAPAAKVGLDFILRGI